MTFCLVLRFPLTSSGLLHIETHRLCFGVSGAVMVYGAYKTESETPHNGKSLINGGVFVQKWECRKVYVWCNPLHRLTRRGDKRVGITEKLRKLRCSYLRVYMSKRYQHCKHS